MKKVYDSKNYGRVIQRIRGKTYICFRVLFFLKIDKPVRLNGLIMRCMHIEIEPTIRQVNHGIHSLIHIHKGMASDVSTLTHTHGCK